MKTKENYLKWLTWDNADVADLTMNTQILLSLDAWSKKQQLEIRWSEDFNLRFDDAFFTLEELLVINEKSFCKQLDLVLQKFPNLFPVLLSAVEDILIREKTIYPGVIGVIINRSCSADKAFCEAKAAFLLKPIVTPEMLSYSFCSLVEEVDRCAVLTEVALKAVSDEPQVIARCVTSLVSFFIEERIGDNAYRVLQKLFDKVNAVQAENLLKWMIYSCSKMINTLALQLFRNHFKQDKVNFIGLIKNLFDIKSNDSERKREIKHELVYDVLDCLLTFEPEELQKNCDEAYRNLFLVLTEHVSDWRDIRERMRLLWQKIGYRQDDVMFFLHGFSGEKHIAIDYFEAENGEWESPLCVLGCPGMLNDYYHYYYLLKAYVDGGAQIRKLVAGILQKHGTNFAFDREKGKAKFAKDLECEAKLFNLAKDNLRDNDYAEFKFYAERYLEGMLCWHYDIADKAKLLELIKTYDLQLESFEKYYKPLFKATEQKIREDEEILAYLRG